MSAASSPRTLRIGIVGIGFGQNVLLPAFRSDERVAITALCASDLGRAQAVAARVGVDRAFGDWRELVACPDVDALAIAVPPVLQPAIAAGAIARGKHVFCEKPVAVDVEAARQLLEQATASGVAHAVDFEFQELASWRRAKELVTRGEIGPLRGFSLSWHVETRANLLQTGSWKQRTELGGGALASFASHSLHLIEWMMGRVVQVNALLSPLEREEQADRRVTGIIELEGGLLGTVSIATDAAGGCGHRLEIHGSQGTLLLENTSGDHLRNFVLTRATRAGRSIILDERTSPAATGDGRIAPVALLAQRFVDAALGGPAVEPGLLQGLRVEELMAAVRSSSSSGTWVQL
jgi:predicted dehydrogenase